MEDEASEQSKLIPGEGQHANQGGWITLRFIIVSMLGQWLALIGATGNVVVYLIREYNFKSVDAALIGNILHGCTSIGPVAGAIFSDAFFGCYPVVVFSTVLSFLSSILFTLSAALPSLRPSPCAVGSDACERSSAGQLAFLWAAMGLLVVGSGGTKFNMIAMGADQFDGVQDRDVFFNWSFAVMYAAGIVGSTVIVFVEDSISWTLGYGFSAAVNAISLVVLLLGSKYYRRPAPSGSPFAALARVLVAATKKWNVTVAEEDTKHYYAMCEIEEPINQRRPSQRFSFLNRAAWICHGDTLSDGSIVKPWRLCTVQQVEDFKSLLRILPLWSSSIFLSVSISIQLSLTVLQALTMDRSLGPGFSIPAGSMVAASLAATVLSLFLLDRLILPLWPPRPLLRIGLGQIINAAGMAASALVERKRAGIVRSHHAEGQAEWEVPMTALWLVLPLAATGVAEALHFPGQAALYYQEFPRSLKSTATGMMALLMALGFYLGNAVLDLVRGVTGWLPDNINGSKLENVYWLVTVLTLINFAYYLLCAWHYENDSAPDEASA